MEKNRYYILPTGEVVKLGMIVEKSVYFTSPNGTVHYYHLEDLSKLKRGSVLEWEYQVRVFGYLPIVGWNTEVS